MMSRTLLILAASRYQLDAIRTAKRLGHRVITTDNKPDNPGHALADEAFNFDSTDLESVLKLAQTTGIDGILSPCTDVAVATAAYVAEELGLPGPPLAAARIVTDKVAFRRFLADNNLPHPQFYEIEAKDEVPAGLWDQEQTWIIKPDRSSGSKGIFMVRSDEELKARLSESRKFSPTGKVLIEQFFNGHQGTMEGVLKDGRIAMHFILDRQTAPAPYVTTIGHRLPSQLPGSVQELLLRRLEQVWSLLGVREGVFDCDFVCSDGEIYLIEITPRLGGNSISQLIRHAANVDLVELAIQFACGEPVAIPDQVDTAPTSVVLLGAWQRGRLQVDPNRLEHLRKQPWVKSLSLDIEPGMPVVPFINGRHRVGEAYVTASSPAELALREQQLKQELALEVLTA